MTKVLKFTAVMLLLAGGLACEKKENNLDETKLQWVEALIEDSGDFSLDGCGWLVKVNDINYVPEHLAEQYKQNGMKVWIVYENTNQIFQCFNEADSIIKIKQIKK